MAIKAAIRNLILSDTSLASSLGNRVSPRISKTGDVLPRLSYIRSNIEHEIHLTGPSQMRIDSFNIAINSNSSDECDSIGEDLRLLLENTLNETLSGVLVKRFIIDSQNEGHFYPEGREKPIYEIIMSVRVSYVG